MIGIVIQARLSSSRYPGKVLAPLAGKPMLAHLLDSLQLCRGTDRLVVATSTRPEDEAIASFCRERGVRCRRGPLEDVAGRFLEVAEAEGLSAMVRISGDSPLLDHRLVDEAIARYRAGDFDLVTNVLRRCFPKGQSVEVVRVATLANIHSLMDASQREHVTPYFYARPHEFRIEGFVCPEDLQERRLCVDTVEDMERAARILSRLDRPLHEYTFRQLLALEDGA